MRQWRDASRNQTAFRSVRHFFYLRRFRLRRGNPPRRDAVRKLLGRQTARTVEDAGEVVVTCPFSLF